MEAKKDIPLNIDEYIAGYPEEIRVRLEQLRSTIRKAAPEATEKISWSMPTFYLKENLIHFAVAKHHIGLYPGTEAIVAFAEDLKDFKTSKGGIQLSNDKPLPLELVARIVKFNIERNLK